MKTKRTLSLVLLLLAAVLLLSACGNKDAMNTSPDETAAPEALTAPEKEYYEIEGSTSKDDAPMLLTNTRYRAKYVEGEFWVAFTTGDQEDVTYTITAVNRKVGSEALSGVLFDKDETRLYCEDTNYGYYKELAFRADESGKAATSWFDNLEPKTTYYLCITCSSKTEFSLLITDPTPSPAPELTRDKQPEKEDLVPAANQEDAPLLQTGVKYHGKYTEGYSWFAFRTGKTEDAEYTITAEGLRVGSEVLSGTLYNEAGTRIGSDDGNFGYYRENAFRADDSGKASTGWFKELDPNTLYFICVYGNSKNEYNLLISGPDDAAAPTASGDGVESNVTTDASIVPGENMSAAVKLPLGTKVYGKYTGGNAWLAFTTTSDEDAVYAVTCVNCSVKSDRLSSALYDKNGTRIGNHDDNFGYYRELAFRAENNGLATTSWYDKLDPNTTYYLKIDSSGKAEYSMLVSTDAVKHTAYSTTTDLAQTDAALSETAELVAGTNQNNATLLKTNTTYHGTYLDGYAWFSFRTGSIEDGEYTITAENLKADSELLVGTLHDEFGSVIGSRDGNFGYYRELAFRAENDGKAATSWYNKLDPDTLYYICVRCDSKTEFNLTINAPEPEQTGTTVEAEAVFTQPFELNETQVRFVASEAVFLNRDEALAVLQPVAEKILTSPGHPILLAGSTARFGDQESCARLSQMRAQAVKDALVQDFGIPADQLIVLGLGYEDDPFDRGQDVDANGNFIETEAAKNRRVIVMDAENPIAQELIQKFEQQG